jgi:3-dehydroquinate dehydratase
LNPPKYPIAPITPFIGDHQLSKKLPTIVPFQFSHHEKATIGTIQESDGSVMEAIEIEAAAFCFKSHSCTEGNDCLRIF